MDNATLERTRAAGIDNKVHIVCFTYTLLEHGGGCEREFIETARGLMENSPNIRVTIVTASIGLTRLFQRALTLLLLKKPDMTNDRISTKTIMRELGPAKYIHFTNPLNLARILKSADVIYTKNELIELGLLRLIGRKLKAPVLIKIATPIEYPIVHSFTDSLHNSLYTGHFYRSFLIRAAKIVVNNQDDKKYVENHFNIAATYLAHNVFRVDKGRQVTNNDPNLRILFAGRLTEHKGADLLALIAEQLFMANDSPRFKLKIAGTGESRFTDALINLASKCDGVEFLGQVDPSKMGELYDWADVTLVPSRFETLNRVVGETGAAAKVVVASDIPGPREIVTNRVSGYLIPVDVTAFVAMLSDLAAIKSHDHAKFYEIGLRAQERIDRDFNPHRVFTGFAELFLRTYRRKDA